MSLSERLQSGPRAAPWVIEEVKVLEAEVAKLTKIASLFETISDERLEGFLEIERLREQLKYREETLIGRTRDLINMQNAYDKLEEDHKECDAEIEADAKEIERLKKALSKCITDIGSPWRHTGPARRFEEINRIVAEALGTSDQRRVAVDVKFEPFDFVNTIEEEIQEKDAEIERLREDAEAGNDWERQLLGCDKELTEAYSEIERLKALWYADADPEETEYAEDYYAQIDHRDHVAISKANQKSVDPIADAIDKALQEQRDYFCMSKRTHNYD